MMNSAALLILPIILSHMGVPDSVKLPESHPVMIRADKAYDYAVLAVEAEIPNSPQILKDALVKRIWGWSGPESAWTVNAMGDCNDSKSRTVTTCRSFGLLQVMMPERWGFSRSDVLSNGVTGYRAGIRVMRHAIATCGSVKSGLGLFASGICDGAQYLVKKRCKMIGDEC
jgi:hypothetical protein